MSFLPSFFPVNCYFVEENDGLTLIDAGTSFSFKLKRNCPIYPIESFLYLGGDASLLAVDAPGHTPGSMAFLDTHGQLA